MNSQLKDGNCLSKFIIGYGYKLLKKGNQKVFDYEDLYKLEEDQLYTKNFSNFKAYSAKVGKKTLFFAILGYLKTNLIISFTLEMIAKLCLIFVPYILREIIGRLKDPTEKGKT